MEESQQEKIKSRLDDLVKSTFCTVEFLAILVKNGHLSPQECETLLATNKRSDANFQFYQIIKTRQNAFKGLVNALKLTNQSGVAFMLTETNEETNANYVWFDVQDPISLFVGRESELKKLDARMFINEDDLNITVISQTTSITGLGGIGKTELCRRQLAKLKIKGYNAAWINAENELSITESFVRLAEYLGIPTKTKQGNQVADKEIQQLVKEVFMVFPRPGESIFVYDNCDNTDFLYSGKFLPTNDSKNENRFPKILITSRDNKWEKGETVINVEELELDDALLLMEKGLKQEYKLYDKKSSTELVTLLQCFPLAIQQAISFINGNNTIKAKYTVRQYINEFKMERSSFSHEFLKRTEFQGLSNGYSETAYTTWKLTWDKLRNKGEVLAVKILTMAAYLDAESITFDFLKPLADDKGNIEIQMGDALKELGRYSMLTFNREADTFRIHRLIQHVMSLHITENGMDGNEILSALQLVNRQVTTPKLTMHANAVWNHASKHGPIVDKLYQHSLYTNKKFTPLHLLAENRNFDAVKFLLEHFKSAKKLSLVNKADEYNRTPLFMAASKGDEKTLQLLLNCGSDLKIRSNICFSSLERLKIKVFDSTDWTVLHFAVYYNQRNIASILTKRDDTLVNLQDSRRNTPAILAARLGYVKIVEILKPYDDLYYISALICTENMSDSTLTELGNHITKLDNSKCVLNSCLENDHLTPLKLAAEKGSRAIIKLLISKGAIPFSNDREFYEHSITAAEKNHVDYLKILVEKRQDIHLWLNGKSDEAEGKWTLLHRAAKYGSLEVLKYIIETFPNKAIPNCADTNGDTPLYQAAYEGQLKVVQYLISLGCDANTVNKIGCTPILAAGINNKWDVVRYLLDLHGNNGTNFNAEHYDSQTFMGKLGLGVVHAAIAYDNVEMTKYMLEEKSLFTHLLHGKIKSPSITLLHVAALFNSTNVIEYLSEARLGLDFNAKMDVLVVAEIFYGEAKRNTLSIIESKLMVNIFGYLVWFLSFLPTHWFQVSPIQVSNIFGDKNELLNPYMESSELPSFILTYMAVPMVKLVRMCREYLQVQKDDDTFAGKELFQLTKTFERYTTY